MCTITDMTRRTTWKTFNTRASEAVPAWLCGARHRRCCALPRVRAWRLLAPAGHPAGVGSARRVGEVDAVVFSHYNPDRVELHAWPQVRGVARLPCTYWPLRIHAREHDCRFLNPHALS